MEYITASQLIKEEYSKHLYPDYHINRVETEKTQKKALQRLEHKLDQENFQDIQNNPEDKTFTIRYSN